MKLFFDIVVIGSSPLGILEAIYYSNKGLNVLIIDNSSKIGGAWKSIVSLELKMLRMQYIIFYSEIALSF